VTHEGLDQSTIRTQFLMPDNRSTTSCAWNLRGNFYFTTNTVV